jgi:hypothetical protein
MGDDVRVSIATPTVPPSSQVPNADAYLIASCPVNAVPTAPRIPEGPTLKNLIVTISGSSFFFRFNIQHKFLSANKNGKVFRISDAEKSGNFKNFKKNAFFMTFPLLTFFENIV